MKKFLLATTVILLFTSAFLAYQLYTKAKTHPEHVAPPCTPKCDYSTTLWDGRIDASLAKIMAENYKNDRQKSMVFNNSGITQESDARSVWFPLESLKSYIWSVENKNCLNDACRKEVLGLRIYFAKYPGLESPEWSTGGLSGLQNAYANHHTIFMIPTYSQNGSNIDFDPWSRACGNLVLHSGSTDSISHQAIYFFDQLTFDPSGKNHGTLIPPGDDAGTSF
jgi:hypothetical protein